MLPLLRPIFRSTHVFMGAIVLALTVLAAGPARAAELDPLLPADTESYATVNVRQLMDSTLFKEEIKPALKDFLSGLDDVTGIFKDLGFDLFTDLERVTFASPSSGEPDRGLIIVRGNFDVAKFKAKADSAAKDNEDVFKIHKVPDGEGGTEPVYEIKVPGAPNSLFVCIFSKDNILSSPGKDYIVDAIKQSRLKKKAALKNKDFQALLEKMDAKQTLGLAGLGKTFKGDWLDSFPLVKEGVEKVEAIGGSVTFDKDIVLEMSVVVKTEKEAREIRDNIDKGIKIGMAALALLAGDRKELGLALDVVKSLRVSMKGKAVSLKGRINPDAIQDALKKD